MFLLLCFTTGLYSQELSVKKYIISLSNDNSSRDYSDYYSKNLTDLNVASITVLRAMREKSTLSQRVLLSKLKTYKQNGDIEAYQSLWIIDAIIVTANDSLINLISNEDQDLTFYEDVSVYNRTSELSSTDTSLYHKLIKVVDNLKRTSEADPMNNGRDRKISIIGGALPDFYPYSPEFIDASAIDGESLLDLEQSENWDWLTVSAAGWKDSWDDRGIATESSIEYLPLFGTNSTSTLSALLKTLEDLVNVRDTRNIPNVIALTWEVDFDEKYKLVWDAIKAIESSQIPVLLMYPEGSTASLGNLPGLFVQGYTDDFSMDSDILKAPQLLVTPDGSVYMSDLVSLGYAAGSLALLRNANKRSFLKNRYNALRYAAGSADLPSYDIDIALSVLDKGTTLLEGAVLLAGKRTPEKGIKISVLSESEMKSVTTGENGKYAVRVIAEDILISIDDLKFYADSLSVSLKGHDRYIANFALVPKKRLLVKGSILSDDNRILNGTIQFHIEKELFTSVEITGNNNFEVELVSGEFEVMIIPEFPYGIRILNVTIGDEEKNIAPFRVKKADIGIISISPNPDILKYYTAALDSLELNYAYHYWTGESDISLYEKLFELEYNTAILYSGVAVPLVSISLLLSDLNQFINEGGHLLYTGQKIVEYLSEYDPFKEDGIKFAGNRKELLLYNSKDTKMPIYTLLSGISGADNQADPDELTSPDKIIPLVYYDAQEKHLAGGMVFRQTGGNYALLGFGMEAIHKPNESTSFISRSQLLDYLFKSLWNAPKGSIKISRYDFLNSSNNIRLMRSVPDPIKNKTIIRFYLPQPATVKLELYDMRGNLLSTILDDDRDMGGYEIVWYPLNEGLRLTPGIYFIIMNVQGTVGREHLLLSKIAHL